jgi:hypothetical protein
MGELHQQPVVANFSPRYNSVMSPEPVEVTGELVYIPTPKRGRGRPTTYKPEYCEMIVDFFERMVDAPDRDVLATVSFTDDATKGISKKTEVRRICAELPTLEKFADSIGVTTEHLDNWAKANPDFYDARARAKQKTFLMLLDGMINRRYDTQAAIFVAKNITWMREKNEVEISTAQVSDQPELAQLTESQLQKIERMAEELKGTGLKITVG